MASDSAAIILDRFFPGDTEVTLRPGYGDTTEAEMKAYAATGEGRRLLLDMGVPFPGGGAGGIDDGE